MDKNKTKTNNYTKMNKICGFLLTLNVVFYKKKTYINHIQGGNMKVDPIREQKKIEDIKTLLKHNTRDYCLFVCGINNGLRGGDLLLIKVNQVKNKKIGDYVEIREQKTGKIKSAINKYKNGLFIKINL